MVASISNNVLSEIYQDILKDNNIPFIRRLGAGGIIRSASGWSSANDNIFVNKEDYDKALELYNLYIESDRGDEIFDSEEQI